MEITWKTHRYAWVADPLPRDDGFRAAYVGSHVVDQALGGPYSAGGSYLAEEIAASAGMSLSTVQARLEELVLEGKVRVEEADYPQGASGPQILREHFTEARRLFNRMEFHLREMDKAHLQMHHGGDVGDALDEVTGGWKCDVCRDYAEYVDEAVCLANILRAGETEAASHFVDAVYRSE